MISDTGCHSIKHDTSNDLNANAANSDTSQSTSSSNVGKSETIGENSKTSETIRDNPNITNVSNAVESKSKPSIETNNVTKGTGKTVHTSAPQTSETKNKLPSEDKPLVVIHGVQNTGFTITLLKYIKCVLFILLFLLFSSLFINFYQLVFGNCKQLKEELKNLEELNNNLAQSITELEEQNVVLAAEIEEFEESNKKLANSIQNMSALNEEFSERVESLSNLSIQLDDYFNNQNQTFGEYKETLLNTTTSLKEENLFLQREIDEINQEVDVLEATLINLTTQRFELYETYETDIDISNDQLLFNRKFILQSFIGMYKLSDDVIDISSEEYDNIIIRAIDIFINDSTFYDDYPVGQFPITATEMFSIIDEISTDSETISSELFIRKKIEF